MYMELSKPVTGEFTAQRPVTRSFGVFFDLRLNKRLSDSIRHHDVTVMIHFKVARKDEVQNIDKNPILRNYETYKLEFGMEPYLPLISDFRYQNALTRLRTSSHTLQIDHGRYATLKTPVCDRRWRTCNVTEDEMHFLMTCVKYGNMGDDFYAKVNNRYVDFIGLNDNERFIFLMTNTDPYILVWLSKFIITYYHTYEILQNFI